MYNICKSLKIFVKGRNILYKMNSKERLIFMSLSGFRIKINIGVLRIWSDFIK